MTRKRNIRNQCFRSTRKLPAKQISDLKARLMQINTVIDVYIYHNKKISVRDARAYIEEVDKYKAQALDDARSLQAIEKIICCMNDIIKEQEVDQTDTRNAISYCSSPAYSLPDEDKSLFSQKPINTDSQINENVDGNYMTDPSYKEGIAPHLNIQVDVEIHRAMSGLSIRENETQLFPEECSQSVLRNIEPEITGILKAPDGTHSANENISSRKATEKLHSIERMSYYSETETKAQTKNAKKTVNFQGYDVIFIEPKEPPFTNGSLKKRREKSKENSVEKNTSKKKNIIKAKRNIKDNIIRKQRIKKSKENITEHKKTNKRNKKIDKINKTIENNVIAAGANFKNNPIAITVKANKNLTKTNLNTVGVNRHSNNENSLKKIYNGNMENDLAWIENIRFVREVTNPEFITTVSHFKESFWENQLFPSDWNDHDFDY